MPTPSQPEQPSPPTSPPPPLADPSAFERALARIPPPVREKFPKKLTGTALHFCYDLLWILAAVLGSPWLLYKCLRTEGFAAMLRGRVGFGLAAVPDPDGRPRVLVHGVSVGEVKAARPLIQLLRERHPELEVVVSTTTSTGLQIAREIYPEHLVVQFPADVSFIVARFFRAVHPATVVLVELEVWPNFLRLANAEGIPVAVVNGRITEQSHGRYTTFKHLLPQFTRLSLICVQDEEYARRFLGLGVDPARLVVTGNVKADDLRVGRVDPGSELLQLLGGRREQPVIVAGSTHHPEEQLVTQAWRSSAPQARLLLVPRHPPRAAEIERELGELGAPPQLLSRLRQGEQPDPDRPALVDTIGELERVYGLADLVYVGGSLVPHGGQNMMEPAAQGRPVLFGPHVDNFLQDVALLEAAGACRLVHSAEELGSVLAELLADPEACEAMSRAGLEAVAAQGGATALTLRALERGCLPAEDRPD